MYCISLRGVNKIKCKNYVKYIKRTQSHDKVKIVERTLLTALSTLQLVLYIYTT